MLKDMRQQVTVAFRLLMLLTVLTGVVYPLTITVFAQSFFPWQANGSLLVRHGQPIGSLLIGQSFSKPSYFFGRPSATTPYPYNGASSSGSNLGPSNPAFLATVKARMMYLKTLDSNPIHLIPVDLVMASGSGLDPDITPAAAFYQVPRVAAARRLPLHDVYALVFHHITARSFGFLGEPHVSVLPLNLALDNLTLRNRHGRTTSKS